MFKNVSLLSKQVHGKHSAILLGPDGAPIPAFDAFALSILRNPLNTRKAYQRDLAELFDYLFEAARHLANSTVCEALSREGLVAVLEAYDEFLVHGAASGNEIASSVAKALPRKPSSANSAARKHASLRAFLRLSEAIRRQLQQLSDSGLTDSLIDRQPLLPNLGQRRPIDSKVRAAMLANSMIAGVVSGGPKLMEELALPVPQTGQDESEVQRALPLEHTLTVIDALPTHRDRALYSLCAAAGPRISEALQLLWDDIDVRARKVFLVDPKRRRNHASYLYLSAIERDRLTWKGRVTDRTLLIEPFCERFFYELEQYQRLEYVAHGMHQFVFQYLVGPRHGAPYFLSAASTRQEILKRALRAECLPFELGDLGSHCFRHMYCEYLLNYFPRIDGGFGLPLPMVQRLIGHAVSKSTAKYARDDEDMLEAQVAHANAWLFGRGKLKSFDELKRETLQARLRDIEAMMERQM